MLNRNKEGENVEVHPFPLNLYLLSKKSIGTASTKYFEILLPGAKFWQIIHRLIVDNIFRIFSTFYSNPYTYLTYTQLNVSKPDFQNQIPYEYFGPLSSKIFHFLKAPRTPEIFSYFLPTFFHRIHSCVSKFLFHSSPSSPIDILAAKNKSPEGDLVLYRNNLDEVVFM